MLAKIITCAFQGIECTRVSVEVMISSGLPNFIIVGLPDKSVSEAKERVRSAFQSMGFAIPAKRIVINLAPADVSKEGSHFDLPIALGILAALDVAPADIVARYMALGELGLDGAIKPVSGILPAAVAASEDGLGIIVPAQQAAEAMWAGNRDVLAPATLTALVNHFKGTQALSVPVTSGATEEKYAVDMHDVKGQKLARRALEIAAVGGHHILMVGPPGVGKSMLAQRLPTILPPMSAKEALEISIINSVAGMITERGLSITRPFRSPHHTASQAALTGGGIKAKPGEVSLAHNGVLFLDELPEFSSAALDTLRQPLENGVVTVARANGHITYPAKFQLVSAMNPCKCGHFGDPDKACNQAPMCAQKYQNRISGPMYDRIDLYFEVENLNPWELDRAEISEDSATIRARVIAARDFQRRRIAKFYDANDGLLNSDLSGKQIEESGAFDDAALRLLVESSQKLKLSARGYYKIMRLARTIADMAARENVSTLDISEALMFRKKGI